MRQAGHGCERGTAIFPISIAILLVVACGLQAYAIRSRSGRLARDRLRGFRVALWSVVLVLVLGILQVWILDSVSFKACDAYSSAHPSEIVLCIDFNWTFKIALVVVFCIGLLSQGLALALDQRRRQRIDKEQVSHP